MNVLRSKAEQLADHLRGCIARGELVEPLPNIREWSSRFGVGRGTLELALKILHQEGVVHIQARRGVTIPSHTKTLPKLQLKPLVRWIFHGRDFPDLSALREMFEATAEKLNAQRIQLRIEKCDAARLRAIHHKGESPHEMLLLTSLPSQFQRLFSDFRRSAIIQGLPSEGVDLPYVSIDVHAAVRHAVHRLARRGFVRVSLVLKEGSRHPMKEVLDQACAESSRPIVGEIVKLPMELHAQAVAAQRWSFRINGNQGVIANYPIPASMLMTALMKRGVDVPGAVEIVAINTTLQAVRVVPLPTYYPYPVEAMARILCRAAVHYFDRGVVPPYRKSIPLEMVAPRTE